MRALTETPDPFLFPQTLAGLTRAADVGAALVTFAEPFGLGYFAIGAMPHPSQPYPERFIVSNWPETWGEVYYARGYGERDPSLRAAATLGRAFSVADLRKGLIGPLSPGETEVLDHAATLGFPNGLITPVFRANGYTGMACLVGPGPDPAPRARAVLQFLLEHAHDRLRRLCAQESFGGATLSLRETEILILSRQGMADAAIAQELGISLRTVRFHHANVRTKLGARSRAEALAQAVARHLLPR